MSELKTCLSCGGSYPEMAFGGDCPSCLLGGIPGASDSAAAPGPEEIEKALPGYKVLEVTGRGGMGVVYRARQTGLDREVAIKVLTGSGLDPEIAERCAMEARVTAKLDHPSIVPVHEMGYDAEGRAYYTMRFVRGRGLGEIFALARENREGWNLSRAAGVMVKAAQAVAYAHGKGVVHRDLKPANIMTGTLGEVYVMDWGLAKIAGEEDRRDLRLRLESAGMTGLETICGRAGSGGGAPLVTMDGAVIGTPAYMPPEQAMGRTEEVDHLSDVYSLGAILYELLAGHPPYLPGGRVTTPQQLVSDVAARAPENVRMRQQDAPGELAAICEKAMQRDRRDRYSSALEMAEDLQAFLDGRVVRAYQTGAFAEAGKWVRRNRGLACGAAAALLALLAAVIVQTRAAGVQKRAFESEKQAHESVQRTLTESYYEQGLQHQQRGDASTALACWAETLRQEPGHARAAQRIALALLHNPLPRIVLPPMQHQGLIARARFSPDNQWIATAGYRPQIQLWNAQSSKSVWSHSVESSPSQQGGSWIEFNGTGDRIALACSSYSTPSGKVRMLKIEDGTDCFPPIELGGVVHSVTFSARGDLMAAAVSDGTARVWRSVDGREVFCSPVQLSEEKEPREVTAAALSPDDERILVTSHAGSAVVWRLSDGQELCRTSKGEPVFHASWSPDGTSFIAGGAGKAARIFNAADGQPLTPLMRHGAPVTRTLFHPSGTRVVTAGRDGVAQVWDAQSGQPAGPGMRHPAPLREIVFSPDATALATSCEDGTARIWDVATGLPRTDPCHHGGDLYSAAFDKTGGRLITAGNDCRAIVWALPLPPRPRLPGREFYSLIRPEGSIVLCTSQALRLLDANTGKSVELERWSSFIASGHAISADGSWLATAGSDRRIQCRRIAGQRLESAVSFQTGGLVVCMALSRDGTWLAAARDDAMALVWDLRAPEREPRKVALKRKPRAIQISGDGERLYLPAFMAGEPIVWSVSTGAQLLAGEYLAMALNAAGSRLAAGNVFIEIRDAATLELIPGVQPMRHTSSVSWLAFSPDGRRLLSTSHDNKARIWDAATGLPLTEPLLHSSQAVAGAWSPDGTRAAITTLRGDVSLWDAATGEKLLTWKVPEVTQSLTRPEFLPDGRRLLVLEQVTNAPLAQFDIGPRLNEPVPTWLGGVAEALGGQRLTRRSLPGRTVPELVPAAEAWETLSSCAQLEGDDGFTKLIRWVLADPGQRPQTMSPAWQTDSR